MEQAVHRWIVLGFTLGIALPGCSRDRGVEPIPDAGPVIRWVSPSDGASLADSLRMEVVIEGAGGVRFSVEGSTVASVVAPPWRCVWLPAGETRSIEIAAETLGGGARAAIQVHWSPNQPPELRWIGVTPWPGVDRNSGDSLRVEAIDPEDGALRGEAIEWLSDRQGFLGRGGAVPLVALSPGDHRIRARARDRWGRTAVAERAIVAFDFQTGSSPEGLLDDLRHSWLAGDFDRYLDLLGPEFRFIFCSAEREVDPAAPPAWRRADEERFVRSLQEGPGHAVTRFQWSKASIRIVRLPAGDWRQVEVEGMLLDLAIDGSDTLRVRDGRARLWLRRDGDSVPWRIEQWSDLGASGPWSLGRIRSDHRRKQ